MSRLFVLLLLILSAFPCYSEDLFTKAATANGISPALLRSIAEMESQVNPWAVNLNREGFIPSTKADAIDLVQQARNKPWLLRVDYKEESHRLFFTSSKDATAALSDIRSGANLLGIEAPHQWEIRLLDTRSVDIGLMQINWKFHGRHFDSLDELFEPRANINYAARYLGSLIKRHGDVENAVAHYHSNTEKFQDIYLKGFLPIYQRQLLSINTAVTAVP
ncbi:lytic transglycosylase domain-containing protein [Ketobacter sp. MCCC 1A13808]|uniref:lytic transglycosylase domain-containing protein n=1 Tax=Ketobacter sp. MCCC 1A13808 TaxID=2602738 RepID=UPI000F1A1939|nr:lytic transglycosylase domain-containing protein [Ketobacter sp. MCCC 1A13808]MVF14632.1 lytic transglycosylase domain-containing protein [Ketobacter sp. MCCC 1A13808]RLP52413.1 MAG: hypothetical protein D6160_20935 [Ketobacter sp.]